MESVTIVRLCNITLKDGIMSWSRSLRDSELSVDGIIIYGSGQIHMLDL